MATADRESNARVDGNLQNLYVLQWDSQDNTTSRDEQEEKLILNAWQSMSVALQQYSLCKAPRAPGPAQSFLAKQRQSTQARRTVSSRQQPG
ncbi:protein Hook homolog 2-like [Lampris incognitus]|uniref:protein Hook homolog 2-like n=1 Tax=Lampris incognitus TaxID=2546036 RepID=UPI0024B5D3ED|nr:protein Hook homolog 2-like [Lampris incognitus]